MIYSYGVNFTKGAFDGLFWRILHFSFMIFIEGICVVALALTMITISGSTFHPLLLILFISGWYF